MSDRALTATLDAWLESKCGPFNAARTTAGDGSGAGLVQTELHEEFKTLYEKKVESEYEMQSCTRSFAFLAFSISLSVYSSASAMALASPSQP